MGDATRVVAALLARLAVATGVIAVVGVMVAIGVLVDGGKLVGVAPPPHAARTSNTAAPTAICRKCQKRDTVRSCRPLITPRRDSTSCIRLTHYRLFTTLLGRAGGLDGSVTRGSLGVEVPTVPAHRVATSGG